LARLQEKHKENDCSQAFTGTAVRGRHEFTAASDARVGCRTPYATALSGKEKEDGESVLIRLFYIHLTKNQMILLSNLAETFC